MAIEYRRVDIHEVDGDVLYGMHLTAVDRNLDFYPDDPEPTLEYSRANWLAPQGIHRKEQWWVAFEGDDVVGTSRAITWVDHEDSGLVVVAVRREHRNRGIGRGLMAHSLDDLEAEGRSKLIIDAPVAKKSLRQQGEVTRAGLLRNRPRWLRRHHTRARLLWRQLV